MGRRVCVYMKCHPVFFFFFLRGLFGKKKKKKAYVWQLRKQRQNDRQRAGVQQVGRTLDKHGVFVFWRENTASKIIEHTALITDEA